MQDSDFQQRLNNTQYEQLPVILSSIFGVLVLTAIRDYFRAESSLPLYWYIYFAVSLILAGLLFFLRIAEKLDPANSNLAAAIGMLTILMLPIVEILMEERSGVLYLSVALLSVSAATNSMRYMFILQGVSLIGWLVTAYGITTINETVIVVLMTVVAVCLAIIILNRKLKSLKMIFELETRVSELESFLPICSNCKKTRDEQGNWTTIESYLQSREEGLKLTHGVCPECRDLLFSQ